MAKKEMRRRSDDRKRQPRERTKGEDAEFLKENEPHKSTMSVTFERLEALRQRLLEESTDRRQRVESLVKEKEGLLNELGRSEMENESLADELRDLEWENFELEMQRSVLSIFLEIQLSDLVDRCNYIARLKAEAENDRMEKEKGIEILTGKVHELLGSLQNERKRLKEVTQERDTVKRDCEDLVAEANGLKNKVLNMERRGCELDAELEKLKFEGERLKEEAIERKTKLESLMVEKERALEKLADSELIIEEWKEKVDVIQREKHSFENERNAQQTKVVELEGQVEELKEELVRQQKEDEALRTQISDLEKALGDATRKEMEMEMVIVCLQEEKENKERCIKNLKEERDALQMSVESLEEEIQSKQKGMDEIMTETDRIKKLNLSKEDEIVRLRDESRELSNVILQLREVRRGLEEKNKELISVVDNVTADCIIVKKERDFLKNRTEEQGCYVENLTLKVSELERYLDKTSMELRDMETEKNELLDQNKAMESRIHILVEEREELLKSLREVKEEFNSLGAKIELANANTSRAMSLIKDTAAFICPSTKDNGAVLGHETKLEPFAHQLDAIKDAFNNKHKMVEEMEAEITSLQKSVVESQKRKNFLTVLSFATAFFSAASVAYVARGR